MHRWALQALWHPVADYLALFQYPYFLRSSAGDAVLPENGPEAGGHEIGQDTTYAGRCGSKCECSSCTSSCTETIFPSCPVQVLKNLNGVIKPGKLTLLLGPPGSGKSR